VLETALAFATVLALETALAFATALALETALALATATLRSSTHNDAAILLLQ
tara:strand:+ start:92 stop:247 length:156 start_codon:yes stop_codon:yes gene_type:complete